MPEVASVSDPPYVARELTEMNARLRLAMDAGRMAVWDVDAVTGEITASPELNRLLDFQEGAPITVKELRSRYLPTEGSRVREAAAAALARGERYFEVEFRYRWRDRGIHWMQLRAEIMTSDGPMPRHLIGILLDITERKEAEERLKLLAREVDHRANNLLAVAQAAVRLSRAESVDELKDVIEGRLAALGHVHNLLARNRWVGADLHRLVAEELKPYPDDRVHIDGPSVILQPDTAQSIAMVLHELCTNAAKYGALKVPNGRLDVTWRIEPSGALEMVWTESGATGVAEPTHRGFGVGMVKRAMQQMKGTAVFDWRPEGLVCRVVLPPEGLA